MKLFEIYFSDGPWKDQIRSFPEFLPHIFVQDFITARLEWNTGATIPPEIYEYQVREFHQASYKRVPKLRMVNLLFERKAFVASVGEPPTEVPEEILGDWELVEESDFIKDHDRWFAEKCYKYGLLAKDEIW